jgi:prepilin-type N-terminal cleavage/methylation domain-containing protein
MINKLMKGFKKNNKGFTLVELMVVVVIIGILVAIAVPVYNASQKTARVNADKANVRILKGAGQQYITDEGIPGSEETWDGSQDQNWEDYLQNWPDNPEDKSKPYKVIITTDGKVKVEFGTTNNDDNDEDEDDIG